MAFPDTATTEEDTPISINVLANDTGLADEPLTLMITGRSGQRRRGHADGL